jgi:hypothetical protein
MGGRGAFLFSRTDNIYNYTIFLGILQAWNSYSTRCTFLCDSKSRGGFFSGILSQGEAISKEIDWHDHFMGK